MRVGRFGLTQDRDNWRVFWRRQWTSGFHESRVLSWLWFWCADLDIGTRSFIYLFIYLASYIFSVVQVSLPIQLGICNKDNFNFFIITNLIRKFLVHLHKLH